MTGFLGFRVAAATLVAAFLSAAGTSVALAAGKTQPTASPASVTITTPSSGSTQNASFTTTGSASTSARRATISSVQVSVDGGAYQAASGTTSWSYGTSGLASGSHSLTAKATDSAGNSSTTSISVNVAAAGGGGSNAAPPTSAIVWPRYAGTVVSGTYTLSGSSSDANYSISKVQWAIDGSAVASSTTATNLNYAWDTTKVAAGTHTVTYATWNAAGGSSSSSLPVTVGAATVKRVAVILYNFQNQAPPTTVQTVRDWTFGSTRSVAGYYNEDSYGRLVLGGAVNPSGDVYGFFTIPYDLPTTNSCNFSAWETSALAQASNAGFNSSAYDVYMLTAAVPSGCGSGVGGGVQDRVPWNDPSSADQWISFAAHELGHSFGIQHHASSYTCTNSSGQAVQVGGTCTSSEYGDPYDIMGSGQVQHMSMYEKGQIGVLRAGNAITVTTSGTYTLAPATEPSSGVQSIRIPHSWDANGNPVDFYYFEFRQPTAYDVLPSGVVDYDGVQIRIAPDYAASTAASKLVDATPGSITDLGCYDNWDARMPVGGSFQDMALKLTVQTVSTGATGATIKITFG